MPMNYTNRKGQTYTLYRGQTKTGKPRSYVGHKSQSQGEPVMELPPGFTISESVNDVVSPVKDRPSLIMPMEVTTIEAAIKQHPEAHQYRIAVKPDHIEIYKQSGPNFDALVSQFQAAFQLDPGLASRLQSESVSKAKLKGQSVVISPHQPLTKRAVRNVTRYMEQGVEWILIQKKE